MLSYVIISQNLFTDGYRIIHLKHHSTLKLCTAVPVVDRVQIILMIQNGSKQ